MVTTLTPIKLGPGDIGFDPVYRAVDDSDFKAQLEAEQLRRIEKSLTVTDGEFEQLFSDCDQYGEIIHWLGQALFTLINAHPQVGRNRYAPARKYISEVQFEMAEALDLLLVVLWEKVNREVAEEYARQLEKEIPF